MVTPLIIGALETLRKGLVGGGGGGGWKSWLLKPRPSKLPDF